MRSHKELVLIPWPIAIATCVAIVAYLSTFEADTFNAIPQWVDISAGIAVAAFVITGIVLASRLHRDTKIQSAYAVGCVASCAGMLSFDGHPYGVALLVSFGGLVAALRAVWQLGQLSDEPNVGSTPEKPSQSPGSAH